MSSILARHCRRYALLEAADVYKLIHQGVFGPGHMISSVAAARRSVAAEVRSQKPEHRRQSGRLEELIEVIDPRGRLVRVNLRPLADGRCKVQGAKGKTQGAEWLVEAMVESAARVKGDPWTMRRRLAAAVRWCRTNLPRQAAELGRMAARAEEAGFPAFHHSAAYSRAYHPAYRVVLRNAAASRASGRADEARG